MLGGIRGLILAFIASGLVACSGAAPEPGTGPTAPTGPTGPTGATGPTGPVDPPDSGVRTDARVPGEPDTGMDEPDAGMTPDADLPDMGEEPDAGPMPVDECPASGPFGTGTGETVANVMLPDCDGNMHSLHDLCGRRASWIFTLAGWCGACRAFADEANALYTHYRDESEGEFAAYFVVAEDDQASTPSAAFCASVRERYGLEMTVLFDRDGQLVRTLGIWANHWHIVLGADSEIMYKQQYDDEAWQPVVETALGLQ